MARVKVQSGCRDCRKCTNSNVANLGRNSGRVLAGVYTAGMSELGMSLRKKCRICGHQMSLHVGAEAVTPHPAVEIYERPAAPSPDSAMRFDTRPEPAHQREPVVSVIDELTKLAALRREGIITENQFEALRDQLVDDQEPMEYEVCDGPIFVTTDSGDLHDPSDADLEDAFEEFRSGESSIVVLVREVDNGHFAQVGPVGSRTALEVCFGGDGEFLRTYPVSFADTQRILTAWIDNPMSVLDMASWEPVDL